MSEHEIISEYERTCEYVHECMSELDEYEDLLCEYKEVEICE